MIGKFDTMCTVLLLAAFGCTHAPREGAPQITITYTPEGYLFAEGRDSVLVYRHRTIHPERDHVRAHYVHPLFGPGGEVLTEDAPADHPHQHGLYWAWHQVYAGGRSVGDGWTQEDITWKVRQVDVLEESASSALRAHVLWLSPRYLNAEGDPEPFVEETATLRVYPTAGSYREMDVTIELRALVDSVLIGGSEDEKGYGGFSARVRLPEDVQFVGPGGPVEPIETAVEAGPWMDVSATYAGTRPSGLAILQHPANPGYPQSWILRRTGSMQNVKWPGAEAVLLPRGDPIVLRYRLVAHRGGADALDLERLHARYAALAE